jgi:hypothetical protein
VLTKSVTQIIARVRTQEGGIPEDPNPTPSLIVIVHRSSTSSWVSLRYCRRSGYVPVNKLPPEVLSRVLEHRDRELDLVAATHVCQYWRSTLTSSPSLWTRLEFVTRTVHSRISNGPSQQPSMSKSPSTIYWRWKSCITSLRISQERDPSSLGAPVAFTSPLPSSCAAPLQL